MNERILKEREREKAATEFEEKREIAPSLFRNIQTLKSVPSFSKINS